jgi:hypothetical protein
MRATSVSFSMTAEPLLELAARLLAKHRLEAVLIGNAAAALQGAPVTTMDLDFMFRKTPTNLRKLRRLADDIEAVILQPYYPASGLFRVVRDRDGLQLDFMSRVDGIRKFEALRARASEAAFAGHRLYVAALEDIAAKPQRTVLRIAPCSLSFGRRSVKGRSAKAKRRRKSSTLRREADRALVEQIRRQLALPMERRVNFLRKRWPNGGSYL